MRTILGPKSFWLESKAGALREKAYEKIRREDIARAARKEHASYSSDESIEEVDLPSDGQPGERKEMLPVTVRKEAFLELIQKKAEMKRSAARNVHRRRRSKYSSY